MSVALHWRQVGLVLAVWVTFLAATETAMGQKSPAIIRPPDDRRDYYQVSPELQAIGNSICALIRRASMTDNGNGTFTLNAQTLEQQRGPLCPNEPFANQPAVADCSVTLIAPDIVITAGHCFQATDTGPVLPFETWYFVFDYIMRDANTNPVTFNADQVYSGVEMLGRMNVANTANDWAVVRLDRAVTGRTPVNIRTNGTIAVGQQVITIGFGAGLPMKFSSNATVQNLINFGFEANLDIIEGNSGGAVINVGTNTIEGVVSGDLDVNDFFQDGNCMRATQCPNDPICQPGFSAICAITVQDFLNTAQRAINDSNGRQNGCAFGAAAAMPMTILSLGLMKLTLRHRRRRSRIS